VGLVLIYQWGAYGAGVTALIANTMSLFLRWRGLIALLNELRNAVPPAPLNMPR
jgi:hypothetical protein